MIQAVTYYEVACDAEGCGTTTAELGDFSAWEDADTAADEWQSAGGTYDEATGATFCEKHTPRCPGCELPLADEEHEDDCPTLTAEPAHRAPCVDGSLCGEPSNCPPSQRVEVSA